MLKPFCALAIATLASGVARAEVDLIAIGTIPGNYEDLATQTAPPLENGVAGNRFGGIGSGFAHAGGDLFLALPDRGPNATPYNGSIDDTTSYIARFHTLHITLAPADMGSPLPFVLTPNVFATTLLSSKKPLVYGTDVGLGVGSGVPALNAIDRTSYFTGRSDGFDPAKPSNNPGNARLDPESIRVSRNGKSVFISDEYGPYVYEFDRSSGERKSVFTLPPKFAVALQSPKGDVEIGGNATGRVANKGMEGLAISPDGKTLFGILQSPLAQDGGTDGAITRIVQIDVKSGATREIAYRLDNIGTPAKPKYPTVSDIVAISDHEFLVDERDGKGLGDDSSAAFKKLYRIDLTAARDVSALSGEASLAPFAVPKVLFLDVVQALNANGIASQDIPAKLEGLAFGPDLVVGGVPKHALYLTSDNDFIATVVDTNHPAPGLANPNRMFVFAIDFIDLPGFVPQERKGD